MYGVFARFGCLLVLENLDCGIVVETVHQTLVATLVLMWEQRPHSDLQQTQIERSCARLILDSPRPECSAAPASPYIAILLSKKSNPQSALERGRGENAVSVHGECTNSNQIMH